uniref:Uncharacterized protein n=1 Tax=Thermosporothrix sp. COM3 TaxID=2490863 RepID=A0A455STF8_9CHLR|nr:hypothetical protein KTC_51720 [Thermosporothrix sp. COM3]
MHTMTNPGQSEDKEKETRQQQSSEDARAEQNPEQTPASSASQEGGEQQGTGKKRVKKVVQIREEDISPHSSLWPLLTTAALSITLVGFIFNPIVFGIGVVLLLGCILGWVREGSKQRKQR